MQRQQFTFYLSFWDAMQSLPKKDRLAFVEAMCSYALYGEESTLSGSAAASAFCIVKPILDKGRQKAQNGKAGGSKSKQNEICLSESASNKTETETETETVTDTDTVPETDDRRQTQVQTAEAASPVPTQGGGPQPDASPSGEDEGQVVAVVVDEVGELGSKGRAELNGFLRDMGPGCVLRALDVARDAGKPTWPYVRGVLRRKQEQGVSSLAGWDKAEASFLGAKAAAAKGARNAATDTIAGTPRCVQPTPDRAAKNSRWLEEFLEGQ